MRALENSNTYNVPGHRTGAEGAMVCKNRGGFALAGRGCIREKRPAHSTD